MRRDLEQTLVDKYPSILVDYKGDPQATCMAWGLECGDGWYSILNCLLACIDSYITNVNSVFNTKTNCLEEKLPTDPTYMHPVIFSQVKEKYGMLRVYTYGGNDAVDQMIAIAETMSQYMCETCGSPGILRGEYWYHTSCDSCLRDLNERNSNA